MLFRYKTQWKDSRQTACLEDPAHWVAIWGPVSFSFGKERGMCYTIRSILGPISPEASWHKWQVSSGHGRETRGRRQHPQVKQGFLGQATGTLIPFTKAKCFYNQGRDFWSSGDTTPVICLLFALPSSSLPVQLKLMKINLQLLSGELDTSWYVTKSAQWITQQGLWPRPLFRATPVFEEGPWARRSTHPHSSPLLNHSRNSLTPSKTLASEPPSTSAEWWQHLLCHGAGRTSDNGSGSGIQLVFLLLSSPKKFRISGHLY